MNGNIKINRQKMWIIFILFSDECLLDYSILYIISF